MLFRRIYVELEYTMRSCMQTVACAALHVCSSRKHQLCVPVWQSLQYKRCIVPNVHAAQVAAGSSGLLITEHCSLISIAACL